MKRKINDNGFTLIELLAVIIILGILMIIAIPSVTEYITSSRKKAYIITASNYISSVRNKVNSLEYKFTDIGTIYYVPSQCITLEKGGKSPFGEWRDAYVVITFDGNGYTYYWTSVDSAGYGVELKKENELNETNVVAGITTIDKNIGVEGRTKIGQIDANTCDRTPIVTDIGSENGPTENKLADFVQIGDFVDYDAGIWTATLAIPTSSDPWTFGGYTEGTSRNKSVTCYSTYANHSSGWRVLNISEDIVTLIHAGTSECFYHFASTLSTVQSKGAYNSVKILTGSTTGELNPDYPSTPRDWSMYVNSTYATSATAFTTVMLNQWKSETGYSVAASDLMTTGSYYYTCTASNSQSLERITFNGLQGTTFGYAFGIRLVITLKAGVQTSGQGTDAFGNTAWKLT